MPDNQGQLLLDLNVAWQRLIRARSAARQGTTLRSEIDIIYFTTLPVIVQITEAVNEIEIYQLIMVAMNKLKPITSNQGETT